MGTGRQEDGGINGASDEYLGNWGGAAIIYQCMDEYMDECMEAAALLGIIVGLADRRTTRLFPRITLH